MPKDPTLKEMMQLVTAEPFGNHEPSYDDYLIGIYHFASANYAGEHSNLYKAMCEIDLDGDNEPDECQNEIIARLDERFGGQ
jgi:hypothetical protein